MKINFYKYEGTGNDFIIIDNRNNIFDTDDNLLVARLCNRRFGIGADGLMFLENENGVDFKMIYYNADGNLSSMCGNGGRCISHFANAKNIINDIARFSAPDGIHTAFIMNNNIKLSMNDVKEILLYKTDLITNTGSPHYIHFSEDISAIHIIEEAQKIRYSDTFETEGINVNFVQREKGKNKISVRTYERGVEDETLSCGTGVTASAISYHHNYLKDSGNFIIDVSTKGGNLKVYFQFDSTKNIYSEIFLEGEVKQVFTGEFDIIVD